MDIKNMTNNELVDLLDQKEAREQLSTQEFLDVQEEAFQRLRNAPDPLVIPEDAYKVAVVVTDTFDRVYYIKANSAQEALDLYNNGRRGEGIFEDINSNADEYATLVLDPDGNEVINLEHNR